MDKRELERRIRAAYKMMAPDILESVLSDCDAQKGQVIVMLEKKKKSIAMYIAGLVAALLLIIGGLTSVNIYHGNHAIASTIMLDVNPSIEIQVNKDEKVLDVKALNEDAKIVVGDMDFAGSSLEVTVNALIGSMLRHEYISNAANSILVTVDNSDQEVGQAMQSRLMSEISAILESGKVSGAVLGQTVTNDSGVQELADQYGITVGKAKLIKQITQQNTIYTFEDLVSLTINELNLISGTGRTKLENIESIGTASSTAYITVQAAKEAAFEHAGINAANAVKIQCELDWEHGMMIYEVDFDAEGFEYEYEINAITGEVVKHSKEADDDHIAQEKAQGVADTEKKTEASESSQEPVNNDIGAAAAKAAALNHCGASKVSDYECELEREHGIMVYEISFKANGYEYDYEIDASSGVVLKSEKERD